jgi:2-polyprenyl-3-methyl-5-hydroxy-6-metoxy-1,4-benzoquinol methylase
MELDAPDTAHADRSANKPESLADVSFWENYWRTTTLPSTLNLSDPPTKALVAAIDSAIRSELSRVAGLEVVEIGCAPGRWLAHFYALGMRPDGIEKAPEAARLTRANLDLLGIEADIYEVDVLEATEELRQLCGRYDVVISLGLLEHFIDPEPVLAAHAELARPGGLVIVGVPNFRGINGLLQKKLDPRLLELHNTEVMSIPALEKLAIRCGLEVSDLRYCGGFDPNLFSWEGRSYLGWVATRLGKVLRRMPRVGGRESRFWSGYLLGVFRKPRH